MKGQWQVTADIFERGGKTAPSVDEDIRADLMGHKLQQKRYGAGATLAIAAEILERIAF